MNIKYHPQHPCITTVNFRPLPNNRDRDDQNSMRQIGTENELNIQQESLSNQSQKNSLTASTNSFLDQSQRKTLSSILQQPYIIPGKNGTTPLKLNLHLFLKELQARLQLNLHPGERVSIKLIGSAAGHIITPQQTGYNDLDFLIQIQMPIMPSHLSSPTYIDGLIKGGVAAHFLKTTRDIQACLATQLKFPTANENVLISIGNTFFSGKPTYINTPINWLNFANPTDNRCSIIKFGMLEFKTVIDIIINDEPKPIVTIPGLKHFCAFQRDSFRICLTNEFLDRKKNWMEAPLEIHTSDIPIEQALAELNTKELRTSHIDGSKCLKGNDNITFKGCFYPEEETNRAIYIEFLKDARSPKKMTNHFDKYQNIIDFVCALSNFFTNSTNLQIEPKLIQPYYEILPELLPNCGEISEKLLLKWYQLLLFLSADHENSTVYLCKLNLDRQIYHLLRPKQPLTLLKDFMQLWFKQTHFPFEKLPKLNLEIKSILQLFAMLKPHIENEQFISFNLCLLSSIPTALDDENNLEFEMLTLLIASLPKQNSTENRKKLIRQTELLLKKRNFNAPELFEILKKYVVQTNELQISRMFLISIQPLSSISRNMALSLWSYAEREDLFSALDELEAFICFEKEIPSTSLNKKQLISLLERMMFRLSYVLKKLTSESNEQPESFNKLLLSLAHQLSQEDLNSKDLDFIENFLKDISALSENLKEKIGNKFLDTFIRLSLEKKVRGTEQSIILSILNEMLETCSNQVLETHMNKVLCYLRTFLDNPFHASSFLSIFDMLKNYLEKDALLKEQALEIYTSLMHYCLNNQTLELIQIAEKGLRKGIKSTCPSLRTRQANLFSDLIFFHAKTDHAQILLAEAVESNILNHENPSALTKSYETVLEGLINSNSNRLPKFVETSLQSVELVQAILKTGIKDSQELILLLIKKSHQVESMEAITHLVTLFQHLCNNTFINSFNEKKKIELEILKMLFKVLPDLSSIRVRQAFVNQAQLIFEKKKLDATQLFNQLNAPINFNQSTSSLFLQCISELALTSPELALSLWQHAEKEKIFVDSVVNELEAFTCIQKMQINKHLSKIQIIAYIQEAMNRLTSLSKKLTSKDLAGLDNFNAYLLFLISKLASEDLNHEDLKFIQNLLNGINPLPFITKSFKVEISEDFLDCLIKLAAKKLTKNELNVLLNILKEILKIHPERTVKKIVQCLRAFPNGPSLAGDFFKTSFFTSKLIEEIKNGELANRVEWFTALYKGKLLPSDDTQSLECCLALVNEWSRQPIVKLCQQLFPALQLLAACIEKKKGKQISSDLKNQALNSYIHFVQECINSRKLPLLQEAERALRAGNNFLSSLFKAQLYSALICAYPKTHPAVALLNEVIKQNILTEKSPSELVRAYTIVFVGLTQTNPTKISNFAETALLNSSFVKLLLNPNTENVNELILLILHLFCTEQSFGLVNKAYQIPSPTAVKNLIILFKQLYKNRNASQNDFLDDTIRLQTLSIIKLFAAVDYVSFKQWVALTNVLTEENSMFQDKEKKELFTITLKKISQSISQFIGRKPLIGTDTETYLKVLKVCDQFQELPCFSLAATALQAVHLQILFLLNRPKEILQKLNNIKEDWLRFRGVEQTILILLDFENQKFTNDATKILDQVLEMLEQFREPHALARGLMFVDLEFLHHMPDKIQEDETGAFIEKIYDILEELLKSHPEKFENLEATCTLVIKTACNNCCIQHALSLLNYAVNKKILVNQETIEELKSKIQETTLEVIQVYLDGFKEELAFGGLKAKSDFLGEILMKHQLIDLLILHSHEALTNELILLLVNHSNALTSEPAIKKLVRLIKKLLLPENINGITCELMCAISFTLKNHAIISKNHAEDVKNLTPLIIERYVPNMNNFILTYYKDDSMKDSCLKALSVLKNLEPFPLEIKQGLFLEQIYRQNLILLNCMDELLIKLQNIQDPNLGFRAIQNSLYFIFKIKPSSILNPTHEIIKIAEMLEQYCNGTLEYVIDMEPLVEFVLLLVRASNAKEPIIDHFLRILNVCLQSHPEKFVDQKSTCTAVFKAAAKKHHMLSANMIYQTAAQQNIQMDSSILIDLKIAVDELLYELSDSKS